MVEAIKPNGRHYWRAARLHANNQSDDSMCEVCFNGDKKIYKVERKNVRKRPVKKPKPVIKVKTTVVVDLTGEESISDEVQEYFEKSNPNVGVVDFGKGTGFKDPYLEQKTNLPIQNQNKITGLYSEDPYALDSPEPPQTDYYTADFPLHYPPQPQHPLHLTTNDIGWKSNNYSYTNNRRRKGGGKQPRHRNTWYNPTNDSYNNNNSVGGYQEQAMSFPTFDMGTTNIQHWSTAVASEPPVIPDEEDEEKEVVIPRKPGASEKVAREQEKLGIGADLARISVPRKPLPKWLNSSRRTLPRMSLGGTREKLPDEDDAIGLDIPSVGVVVEDVEATSNEISHSESPPRKKKKLAPRRKKKVRKPAPTISTSTDDGGEDDEEIRKGPRLSRRQRVLAEKRKASELEAAARKKEQALATKYYARKKPRLVRASKRVPKVSIPEEPGPPLLREIVAKTRGNGRRKAGVVRRNMGAKRLEMLNSVDKFVTNEYIAHVAKFNKFNEQMRNSDGNGYGNVKKNCKGAICANIARDKADALLHCNLCGNEHHTYCTGIKTFANPLLCGNCVDLIIRGYKKVPVEGRWTRGRRKWLVSVGISPLVHIFQNLKISPTHEALKRDRAPTPPRLRLGLTPEEQNKMCMNVEDLRRGIIKRSIRSNSATKLTIHG